MEPSLSHHWPQQKQTQTPPSHSSWQRSRVWQEEHHTTKSPHLLLTQTDLLEETAEHCISIITVKIAFDNSNSSKYHHFRSSSQNCTLNNKFFHFPPHNYLTFVVQLLCVSERKERVAVKKEKPFSSLKPSSLLHLLLHPLPIPLQ